MAVVLLFVEPQSGRPRAIHVDRSLRVGRAVGPHGIRLDDPSVAPTHADIELREGGDVEVRLVDPEGALFVNGVLRATAALRPGDVLHVGNVAIRVAAAGPAVGVTPVSRPEESVGIPAPEGRRFRISPTVILVAVAAVAVAFIGWPLVTLLRHQLSQPDQRAAEIERVRLEIARLQAAQKADRKKQEAGPTPSPAPAASPTPFPTFYFAPTEVPGAAGSAGTTEAPPTPTPTAAPGQALDRALASVVVVTGRTRSGANLVGSGFFVESGYVVTNAHVVEGGDDLAVRLPDGPRLKVTPVKLSRELDLAVLRVAGGDPPAGLPFGDSTALKVGQQVYAVGSPMGEELSSSVTSGIVSGPRRVIEGRSFVQHDAPINPGNSGGPLLDAEGKLVGVITFKVNNAQGLGFAIPVEDVVSFLRESGNL